MPDQPGRGNGEPAICARCRFWERSSDDAMNPWYSKGYCMRHAPRPAHSFQARIMSATECLAAERTYNPRKAFDLISMCDSSDFVIWPHTQDDDWCGEFEGLSGKAGCGASANTDAPDGWQPIETAPKDGLELDLLAGEIRFTDCCWHNAKRKAGWLQWVARSKGQPGWRYFRNLPHGTEVTHWMRVRLPSASGEEAGDV